jgi:diaminohydroxyphosphoribosylaminopyrimidine deaminase/5-amino-6-(5-phosphoribosylamino)uracil reductase
MLATEWIPDPTFMLAAAEEAHKGAGRTHPNPSVGAVVVRSGHIIGRGFHEGPGHAHAEVVALREAGELAWGADLYVTLEPCCTTGRTGPCTEAIASAGIARVAAAVLDPNPSVRGGGTEKLRSLGMVVHVGLMERDGLAVDPAYHTFYTKGRPHVHLKWAQTLDGRVAIPGGGHITGPEARLMVHRERFLADAILVSASTVVADDPLLTVRLDGQPKALVRVVLDHRGLLTGGERLFASCPAEGPLLIMVPEGAALPAWAPREGVVTCPLPLDPGGRFDLRAVLAAIRTRNLLAIYVEAVGTLSSAFLRAGLVDRISVHMAPMLAGTTPGPSALEGAVSPSGRV